jgi:hypothetical protein
MIASEDNSLATGFLLLIAGGEFVDVQALWSQALLSHTFTKSGDLNVKLTFIHHFQSISINLMLN